MTFEGAISSLMVSSLALCKLFFRKIRDPQADRSLLLNSSKNTNWMKLATGHETMGR
jgi:hypothetical protein